MDARATAGQVWRCLYYDFLRSKKHQNEFWHSPTKL